MFFFSRKVLLARALRSFVAHPLVGVYSVLDKLLYFLVFGKRPQALSATNIERVFPDICYVISDSDDNFSKCIAKNCEMLASRQLDYLLCFSEESLSLLNALPLSCEILFFRPGQQDLTSQFFRGGKGETNDRIIFSEFVGRRRSGEEYLIDRVASHVYRYSLKKSLTAHAQLWPPIIAKYLRNTWSEQKKTRPENKRQEARKCHPLEPLTRLLWWPKKIYQELFYPEEWSIGFKFADYDMGKMNFNDFTVLPMPEHVFWADPFPVKDDNRYFIFFEQYDFRTRAAQIMVGEVGTKGFLSEPRSILKNSGVISYPFVFNWQGAWYLLPETSHEGKLVLYRCEKFPYSWKREQVLLGGLNLCDATLFEHQDKVWLFGSVAGEQMDNWTQLHLFYSNSLLGPWTEHPMNPIISDVRCSRPAGRIYRTNGKIIRPGQDCAVSYGHGIRLNEIIILTATQYEEEEGKLIRAPSGWEGVHTINHCEGLVCTDMKKRVKRFTPQFPYAVSRIRSWWTSC